MFSKEHLRALGINNIYFKTFGGLTDVIRIISLNNYTTTVSSGGELAEKGILVIEENDNQIEIFVSVIKNFSEINTFTLFHEDPFPDYFQVKVNNLNNILSSSEKRKEFRYEVGLKNWQKFGLTKPECIFSDGSHITKNIINNASIHGVLLTGTRSHTLIGEKVIFTCAFEEIIKLQSILINSTSCGNGYFRYSLRFLEPLSLTWCNHVLNYGDLLDNTLDYE